MVDDSQPGWAFGRDQFDELGKNISRMFESMRSTGPIHWDTTNRVAKWVALVGRPEAPVKDEDAKHLTELARVAQAHIAEQTGLASTLAPQVHAVGRSGWVDLNLESLHTTLERLASALQGKTETGALPSTMATALRDLQKAVGPVAAGMQAGVMVGYLAHHMLGQYDMPLPSAGSARLVFVVPNLDAFQSAWSLERDDFRFYVALHEVVNAGVMSVPWVQALLLRLIDEYVSSFQADPTMLQGRFSGIDPSDPASVEQLMADPSALLNAMQSPAQVAILPKIQTLTATLTGYADAVIEHTGSPLISSFTMIREAIRRHRVERGGADQFVGRLLGLDVTREHYERGAKFANGVVERAGLSALNRLWEREEMLPTPAELEAPGLWLARIDLGV